MIVPPGRQQRSIETVEEIVAAARGRFAVDGFAHASTEDIAADCGRTKGSIYHHFASKESLFAAVFAAEQARIADVITANVSDDPVTALQGGIASYLRLMAADAAAARITLIDAPTVLGWQEWRACDGGPFRAVLAAAVRSIDTAGRLRREHQPDLLAELLLGSITEAALTVANATDRPATATAFGGALARMVDGLTMPGD